MGCYKAAKVNEGVQYAAGRLIAGEDGSLRRVNVTGTDAYELKVRRQPSQPLRVTIMWIDKPGTPPPDGRLRGACSGLPDFTNEQARLTLLSLV